MITLDNVEYNNNLSLSCVILNKVDNPYSYISSYNSNIVNNPYFTYKNELYMRTSSINTIYKYTGVEWQSINLTSTGTTDTSTISYPCVISTDKDVYILPQHYSYLSCFKIDLDNNTYTKISNLDASDVLNGILTNDEITRTKIYINSYCYDKINDKIYCETTCTNNNNGNGIHYINEVQITNSTVKLIPICDLSYMKYDTTYDFYQIYPKVVFSYNGELFIAPSPDNNGNTSVLPLYKVNINLRNATVVGFMPYVSTSSEYELTFKIFNHNDEIYCCNRCSNKNSEMAYIYKFNANNYTWEKTIKYPATYMTHEINKDIDVAIHDSSGSYYKDLGDKYYLFSYNGSIHACSGTQHIVYNEYCQQWLDFGYWICKMKNQT